MIRWDVSSNIADINCFTTILRREMKNVALWLPEKTNQIYSFIRLHSHTKGSCEYHMKRQELSSKAPAAGLLPLLRGFLWMPLPWHSGCTICFACAGEFVMALTALQIVTLNEIVEQYVRSDPLRGLLRSSAAAAGESWRIGAAGAWLEPYVGINTDVRSLLIQ